MTTFTNDYADGRKPMPTPAGMETVTVFLTTSVTAAAASADIIKFGKLPAGMELVDWSIYNDDLDTNATETIAADFGLLTSAGTAVSSATADGGKWLTASTILQDAAITHLTGQTIALNIAQLIDSSSSDSDRTVGMVLTASPATGAAGDVTVKLSYRNKQ